MSPSPPNFPRITHILAQTRNESLYGAVHLVGPLIDTVGQLGDMLRSATADELQLEEKFAENGYMLLSTWYDQVNAS